MKHIMKKLRSKKGESISETLVALLISSLALAMLAGAITAAAGMVTKSSKKIRDYYEGNQALVTMEDAEQGNITYKLNGSAIAAVPVKYNTNTLLGKAPIVAYRIDE